MYPSLRQNENSHTKNKKKIRFVSLSDGPPVMKKEDISMFKFIQDKVGISTSISLRFLPTSFVTGGLCNQEISLTFEVCKVWHKH